jgi:dienelactone hydrolase
MRAPPRRALLRAAACAALAACVSAAEPAETDSARRGWPLGERPAFGLATDAAQLREVREATAQGGRGLVTETSLSADAAPTDTHAHSSSAGAESGDVARDVRSREPRVRDAREDTLARILSLSEGLPRDARDAVERAVAVARGASDLQLILEDLAGAAAHALRDEAYWRGEAGTAAAANDESTSSSAYDASAASASSNAAFDFRARGSYRVVVEKRTFYWPPLGFDFAERVTPWVTVVVYLPEPKAGAIPTNKPFPAVAFAVGWNSWVERYDLTMRHLASHGFVVIAPTVADRRARPLFSFDLLSKHLLASLAWLVRESRRPSSALFFGKIDVAKLGLLGHSSGAGAAVRAAVDAKLRVAASSVPSTHDASRVFSASSFSSETGSSEDTDALHAFVSTGIRAVAGMGAFLESSGLDHDALANLRGVAMFQLAGRRDSHVTPRAVADIAAAAVHAAPRAVAVLRYGTHCFLDEASEYEYPDSQCAAALRGESRFFPRDVQLTSSMSESTQWALSENGVGADRNDASSLTQNSASVMSPSAQLEATREYLAAFFVAELKGGDEDTAEETEAFLAFERSCVSEARRKMWGVEGDDGIRRGAATHSSLARGGAGGWGDVDTIDDASTEYARASRSRSLSLRSASPVERTGVESFGEPPPVDVTLAEDPRMSRVEVLAWR